MILLVEWKVFSLQVDMIEIGNKEDKATGESVVIAESLKHRK